MRKQKRLSILSIIILILVTFYGITFSQSKTLDKNAKELIPPKGFHNHFSPKNSNQRSFGASYLLKDALISFLPDVQVNSDPGNMLNEREPVIVVSKEGIIYIAWKGDDSLESILFSRSLDGGETFSPAIKINDDVSYPPSSSVYQPDIAMDAEENIYIVWFDYREWADDGSYTSPIDVYLDKSTDNGVTWGTDVKVSEGGSGTYPWHFQPYIAIDQNNGNIYVSFSDYDRYLPEGDPSDVSVGRSIDGGLSFENKVRVDDCPDSLLETQIFSYIAVDSSSGHVYVTFSDSRNGDKHIYLSKSTDYALSFGENILVDSDTTNEQDEASVKTDNSGSVYVVWNEWSPDSSFQDTTVLLNNIYLAKSINGGDSFSPPVKVNDQYLNDSYGYNFPTRLAVDDSGIVHLVWHDRRNGYNTCFYDQSLDGGETFSNDIMINDEMDSVSCVFPRIAVDNNKDIYVTWVDERNGNDKYDVFFSRNDNITALNNDNYQPVKFTLFQNYPNPFNPQTTIRCSIEQPTRVKIQIYNQLGQQLRTLVNERKQAGEFSVTWDGKDSQGNTLASGIYYYRLTAGNQVDTKKMLYLR